MSEQKENLRKAEASLQDAEKRLAMVKKWQPMFKQAVMEYHGSIQRLKDLAAGDIPRAVSLLSRMIDALEAYLRVALPTGVGPETAAAPAGTAAASMVVVQLASVATAVLDEDEAARKAEAVSQADKPQLAPGSVSEENDERSGAVKSAAGSEPVAD
jgi:hypothetical protein